MLLLLPLDWNFVSVAFAAFGLAFPTFNFGFYRKWSASWREESC